MFGGCILADLAACRQPGAGVDENNVPLACFEQGQESLSQCVRRSDVELILQVQICDRAQPRPLHGQRLPAL